MLNDLLGYLKKTYKNSQANKQKISNTNFLDEYPITRYFEDIIYSYRGFYFHLAFKNI